MVWPLDEGFGNSERLAEVSWMEDWEGFGGGKEDEAGAAAEGTELGFGWILESAGLWAVIRDDCETMN